MRLGVVTTSPGRSVLTVYARSETGNFFEFTPPSGGFDLSFDYTFFCAITPTMRPSWGKRYGEVIRPGGLLICLAFPIGEAVQVRPCIHPE